MLLIDLINKTVLELGLFRDVFVVMVLKIMNSKSEKNKKQIVKIVNVKRLNLFQEDQKN